MDRGKLCSRIRALTQPLSPISVNHSTKLATLSGIRCVAFDFYGTMFISGVGDIGVDEEQQTDSAGYFMEALRDTNFSFTDEQVGEKGIQLFHNTIDQMTANAKESGINYPEPDILSVWKAVLTDLQEQNMVRGETGEEAAARFCIEFEFRVNPVWPIPRLEELLSALLAADLQLGIISNSQFYTPITFEAFLEKEPGDFGFHPDLLVWSYEIGRKKPSVDFYRHFTDAIRKQDIAPEEVLYVGNDIQKDIAPAKKLGMRTALYVGDQRSIRHEPHQLEDPALSPELVIDDLHQLRKALQL